MRTATGIRHAKVFAEKLNLVSGIELGFWRRLDWRGTEPPVHPRQGWRRPARRPAAGPARRLGVQDTHETLNSFTWGPDGWLYGCHGVFTHSRVGKPGTPDADRIPINAGIWRYHPDAPRLRGLRPRHEQPLGRRFRRTRPGVPHRLRDPASLPCDPGGRYERQAGPHFNAYTYDDIKTIADHRHYLGANPHAGNGRSDAGRRRPRPRRRDDLPGRCWPEEYRGSIFMNNIHGARLNRDTRAQGLRLCRPSCARLSVANDRWSQIVSLKYGPDGQMFMIDWYDKNQCHHKNVDGHDRTNGRIFKVSSKAVAAALPDLRKLPGDRLVALQSSANEWIARHARRILQERGSDPQTHQALVRDMEHADPANRLRLLWTLHATETLGAGRRGSCSTIRIRTSVPGPFSSSVRSRPRRERC